MNKIPAFKFPLNSLAKTLLFENDFVYPQLFWKFSENWQKKARGLYLSL